MDFVLDERVPDSPFIDWVWRTQVDRAGTFVSTAASHWEMVVSHYKGQTTLTIRGPETKATIATCPADIEFVGIQFKQGTFMPNLPTSKLVDGEIQLPQAGNDVFWLHGGTWTYPEFENAETLVERLAGEGLLVYDPVVDAVLQNRPVDMSLRTRQRRFLRAVGVTHSTLEQIERAQHAIMLLEEGVSIADAVYYAGYADQPHLTRSVKRFMGRTPAQVLRREIAK